MEISRTRVLAAALCAILMALPTSAGPCNLETVDYQYYDGCTNPTLIGNNGVGCDKVPYSYGTSSGAEWRIIERYDCEQIWPCDEITESFTIEYQAWCGSSWVTVSAEDFGTGCAC